GSGWGTYKTVESDLITTITGKQDIYLVLLGTTDSNVPYIGNFDSFTFTYEKVRTDFAKLELERFDQASAENNPANNGPLKVENGKSEKQVANTFSGAWLAYERIDFGIEGVNELSIEYAGNSGNTAPDSAVEVRLGAVDGPLIGKLDVPPTGNGWGTYRTVTGKLTETITGIQTIYLVLTGTTDNNIKYIGNFDNASFSLSVEVPDSPAIVELEERSEWSSEVNSFNNKPLKTEANNGGTVVANTFDGAWLTFNEVD